MSPSERSSLWLLLETSVVVTYLASRNASQTAVHRLLELADAGFATLLWAAPIADEAVRKASEKTKLRSSIGEDRLRAGLSAIQEIAEPMPTIYGPYPLVCRDSGDDYIIAHARAGRADVVVTLDRDLLALGEHAGVLYVKPGAALALLRAEGANLD